MNTLLKYIKRHKGFFLMQLAFSSIWVVTQLFIPRLMAQIIDVGIVNQNMDYIIQRGLMMIGVTVINILSLLIALFFLTQGNARVSRDIRTDLFSKAIAWSKETRQQFSTSTLITRNINDVKQVSNLIDLSFRKIFTTSITVIGAIIMAFSLDPQLALYIFIIVPIVLFLATRLTTRSLPQYSKIRKSIDRINQLFRQNITGVRVVKAFGKEEYEKNTFDNAVEDAYESNVKAESTMLLLSPLVMLFVNFLILVILWNGGQRVEAATLQIGVLVAIIEYVTLALNNVQQFSSIITIIPRSQVSLERIDEVLKTDEKIERSADSHLDEIEQSNDGIQLNQVTFSYAGSNIPAIDNVSLAIRKNQTTALIGSTGSGKSTLLQLILRQFEKDTGEITIGERTIEELTKNDFNQLFTVIPQTTFLFSGTIRENVQSGKETATDEEIWAVLDDAQIGDFFRNAGEGLDFHISQNAVNLSGGQKQRVAIARGLIKDSEYYIFDDCFSALDFTTEKKVRQAIQTRLKNKTKITIAQRVATVQDAEHIVVMAEGKMMDYGTHDELSGSSQIYREIIASQNEEEVI